MGYTTEFDGQFYLSQKAPESVIAEMQRLHEEEHEGDEFPSRYCQWVLTPDHKGIEWDGNEKFYDYVDWLQYIIDEVMNPAGIEVTGRVKYQGEDKKDRGEICVSGTLVNQYEYPDVSDDLEELSEFRDFVLGSEWGEEILEAWLDR